MSKIKVVNIDVLSYSGTTWLNLLLGTHPDVLTIGPPHRVWAARDKKFQGVCLVHGDECDFWNEFGNVWDGEENFFEALSRFSNKTIFLMDNAPEDFLKATLSSDNVELVRGRYIRDARAITASYARKMADKGETFINSIQPSGWFYPSFMALSSLDEMKEEYDFVIRYEDAVHNQEAALTTVGNAIGITYDESSFRFWEGDHHITMGNQGPIAMVKLHQNLHVGNFESRQLYEQQLDKLKANPTKAFADERWKQQLTEKDLAEFDALMGKQNALLDYKRDTISSEHEINVSKTQNILYGTLGFLRKIKNKVGK